MKRKGSPFTFLLSAFFVSIILTTLPVLALQSNKYISSYGRVNYPTVPALPVSAIWMHVEDLLNAPNPSLVLDNLINGRIWNIFVLVGEWQTTHTIRYWYSDATYTNFINTVKAKNSNFKVHAWVVHDLTWAKVDISTPEYRELMFNAVASCLDKGFDGFNDDLEPWQGSDGVIRNIIGTWQNYIDYLNGMATTVHNRGKIASADIGAGWTTMPVESVYPYLNLDYAIPMLYNGGPFAESDFKGCMDRVLDNSASPVLIGMRVDYYSTIPLSSILTWIDEQNASGGPYPKLAGFSIFEYKLMRSIDWTNWNNWATKGA